MFVARYTRWDGRQAVPLESGQVFQKLSELLSLTDDLRQAIDWLTREGFEDGDARVPGVDELLERLREAMRKRYSEVTLDQATAEVRARLEEVLELERLGLDTAETSEEAEARRRFLDALPFRLSEAIEALRPTTFASPRAREEFDEWVTGLDDLAELEDFIRRYGDLFQGPEVLDYEAAVALMREMQELKDLEEQLFSGELDQVDVERLGELLGDQAAEDVRQLQVMIESLAQSGYIVREGEDIQLSPKGVRKIGEIALRDIYENLVPDRAGGHGSDRRGSVSVRPDRTRRYEFGDPFHLDLVATMKQSLARGAQLPMAVEPRDFVVHHTETTTSASTVLLLDMSWSMSWEGRFAAAKKVALALENLIHTRFPRDYFGIVGFYTKATELKLADLPEASWNMGDPFTNLQDGLRLGARLLAGHPSRNQTMIVITDGQPTAYFSGGRLYCEWPLSFGGVSARAAAETLREVERVTRQGVRINTFMLDDSPALREFVEQMTQINKGRALFTKPDQLGEYLLVDYLGKKRKKI